MLDYLLESFQGISPDEAKSNYIGPLYHGTTTSAADNIISDGFIIPKGKARDDGSRYGLQLAPYIDKYPPPVHWLGYGVYLTFSKNNAKMYAENGGKVLAFYVPNTIALQTINFGAPNTMWKWWTNNGYNPKVGFGDGASLSEIDADRVRATHEMTATLSSRCDAVWFKGKGLRRLLDGDQICVYDPGILSVIDKSKMVSGGIGSKVVYAPVTDTYSLRQIIPGTKGTILSIRDAGEMRTRTRGSSVWLSPDTKKLYEIKFAKGGTVANVQDIDLQFI